MNASMNASMSTTIVKLHHALGESSPWMLQVLSDNPQWATLMCFVEGGALGPRRFETASEAIAFAASKGYSLEPGEGQPPIKLTSFYRQGSRPPMQVSVDGGKSWMEAEDVRIRSTSGRADDAEVLLIHTTEGVILRKSPAGKATPPTQWVMWDDLESLWPVALESYPVAILEGA